MIVVVMGVSGCGKSSVAEALAMKLDLPWLEGDALHPPENVERMSRGIPLNDDDRMPWLDVIGARIAETAGRGDGTVVSCSALKSKEKLAGVDNLLKGLIAWLSDVMWEDLKKINLENWLIDWLID